MVISKSEYMMFLKHPAWLWLKKHDKSKLPETGSQLQAMFDAGHVFEEYAEKLFLNAIKLGFNGYDEYLNLPLKTQEVLDSGAEIILQGRLEIDGITCIFDVLEKVEKNEYDLIEIKSSSSAKLEHAYDLAFQLEVLESAGVNIRNIKVIHLNREFVRGGEIDINKLTVTADITEQVRALGKQTKQNIKKAFAVVASEEMPSTSPRYVGMGNIKEWLEVYKNVHGQLDSGHIYNIASPTAQGLGQLEDLHIEQIADIPLGFSLKPKQKWQLNAHINGRHMKKEKIKEFLDTFEFPLYFLDYETLAGVIPPFNGLKPYQQLPFQYSLHLLETPKSKLKHCQYLHTENTDPTIPLLAQLKKDIGTSGTVLVWNESFEKACNDLMGRLQPEYTEFLSSVNGRIKDLMKPFFNGWFVDKEFIGSASIKKVLPALVNELSYHDLDIQEGATAQSVWMETFLNGGNLEQKEKITKDLLEYCKLDTRAMVEIYKVLRAI